VSRRRLLALLLGLLPLATLTSFVAFRGGTPRARPSVLLVTIDTLRADRVGAYGNRDHLTPNLDALARGGTVFGEARASVPLTLPSHATILTGLEPPRHGVHDNGTYVLPGDVATLATRLKAEGYATGAFVGAYVLDRRFGLARGFDEYDDRIERGDERRSMLESERRGEAVVSAAGAWLHTRSGPFFAWVHLYDPHAPYAPPSPFRETHEDSRYDGEVAYTDSCVGRLLGAARSASGRGRTELLVTVLADHGESLGEHGELTHGFYVYDSTLRIPFILAGPGVAAGERRTDLARTADVMPTVLGRLGLPVPPGIDGMDLHAQKTRGESYAESLYPRTFGWSGLRSYRLGALKLIEAPRPELFDLSADPEERNNLAGQRPEVESRLREALGALRRSERGAARAPADPEAEERLRALGYVSSEAAAEANGEEGRADPKDKIEAYRAFEEATWSEAQGDREAGLAALRRVVGAEPQNPVFRRALATSLRRAGQSRDAVAVLEGLGHEREDAVVWHERALALAEAGRGQEAEGAERRAVELNPLLPEPSNHLGVLLARRGKLDEALARFEAATLLDPNNAKAWSNRANALRGLGRLEEAALAYRRAAELSPRDPDPLNGLGVLAVQAGRTEEAAALFRRALSLAPSFSEARLNLAVALIQAGKRDDARRELGTLIGDRGVIGEKARRLQGELRSHPSKE
jgi:arylsulfatase A-like enzyme/Tfp pilus assembly protein PilF